MKNFRVNKECKIINLDGEWLFNYSAERPENGELLFQDDESFPVKIPVPAHWEDCVDRLQTAPFWGKVKFNPEYRQLSFPMSCLPPDLSLPNVMGTGWYKREFGIPPEFSDGKVILEMGGVQSEAWIWINGEAAGYHLGYSTAFEIPLEKWARFEGKNELIIAVSNVRTDRSGCSNRGPNAHTGGIFRSVNLRLTGAIRICDLYLYPSDQLDTVQWQLKLDGFPEEAAAKVIWQINDVEDGTVVCRGEEEMQTKTACWDSSAKILERWTDKNPKLYKVNVQVVQNGEILDERLQTFGLRRLAGKGTNLFLNGKPVMLRGVTEHCYFPHTVWPPADKKEYRRMILEIKKLGFNWLRFHTWVPPKEYIEVADELGMMIQVEPPAGFGSNEWREILLACRNHPSIVIYCCGNEELIDEDKIEALNEAANICRELVPDALFSPMEALRGVEYYYGISNLGEDYVKEPFAHNPRRLDKLKQFSDVFGQYAHGLLSYFSVKGDWKVLNDHMEMYERPCLTHEMGIHGNYINLDLEHRYEGTRMGFAGLFPSVRKHMKKAGVLDRAAVYYKNSCTWQQILRKHIIEMGRKCKYIAGYDFLGPIDQHFHRFGYPCGIMNEFYEMKPGESAQDVAKYNGESVLLLDQSNCRNYFAGSPVELDVYASLYGNQPMQAGKLHWYMHNQTGAVLFRDEKPLCNVDHGCITRIHSLRFDMPEIRKPMKLTICICLSGGEYELENSWDIWAFPKRKIDLNGLVIDDSIMQKIDNADAKLVLPDNVNGTTGYLVSGLDQNMLQKINEGSRVFLLGCFPLNALSTSFQMSVTGRVNGNLATVIEDHPVMKDFPHDGYCDWQFYSMLEGGNAILFEDPDLPFAPILEVVSSFKWIRKQAAIFELCVGNGKLFVCSLNMDFNDPAAVWLLENMIHYFQSSAFKPKAYIHPNRLIKAFAATDSIGWEIEKDYGFDPNARHRGGRPCPPNC